MRKGWWLFGLICVIWTALVFATAAVITYVMPRKYESVAMVEFRPSGADPAKAPAIDGEMLKMRSRPHLLEVARNLELENRWNLPAEKAADLVFSMLVPAFLLTWLVYGRKRQAPVAPADHGYSRS